MATRMSSAPYCWTAYATKRSTSVFLVTSHLAAHATMPSCSSCVTALHMHTGVKEMSRNQTTPPATLSTYYILHAPIGHSLHAQQYRVSPCMQYEETCAVRDVHVCGRKSTSRQHGAKPYKRTCWQRCHQCQRPLLCIPHGPGSSRMLSQSPCHPLHSHPQVTSK